MAKFSRRSFCSKNLECGPSPNVERFVEGWNLASISKAGLDKLSEKIFNLGIILNLSFTFRLFDKNISKMGSLHKNNKRRRKFLDILKYTDDLEEDEKVQLPVSDTSSDELINDIEQLIDEEMCEYSTNSEFSCTFCTKEFKSKRDVKSHMKVHFQDRPYICSSTVCEKTFKTSSNLRRHERICTNTKNVSKQPNKC